MDDCQLHLLEVNQLPDEVVTMDVTSDVFCKWMKEEDEWMDDCWVRISKLELDSLKITGCK